ncbi:MAG: hypothetical protein LQ342_008147 [Letrouitia transgressa]|nr:MAG: hypothetical protein LQ342_008147 [Letrouitia transgressa]
MANRAQSASNGISVSPMSTPDHDQGNRGENHLYTAPIPNFDHLAVPGPMTHLPSSRSFNASLDRLNQAVDGESASPGSQLSSARDETPASRRPSTDAGQQASTDGHEDANQHTDDIRNDAATIRQEAAAAADSIAHAEQLQNAQQDWHLHQDPGGVSSTVPSTNEAVTAHTAPTTPQQTEPQNPTIQPPGRRSPERINRRRRQRALTWLQRTIRHPLPWSQNHRHDLRYAMHAVRRAVRRGL